MYTAVAREEFVMHTAVYTRVSTFDQEPENQLAELRRYVAARGWSASEYVDRGVSGTTKMDSGLRVVLGNV